MGTRIYVGNLSYDTSEEALREACASGGRAVVRVQLMTDRATGQPRGFAFVDFASDGDAQAAIGDLDGRSLDGRTLHVNEARERGAAGGGDGGARGNGGGERRAGGGRGGERRGGGAGFRGR